MQKRHQKFSKKELFVGQRYRKVDALAYAGFLKGGEGAGNLRIMKKKRKISPLRISPFSCPKLGEDQKKKVFIQI